MKILKFIPALLLCLSFCTAHAQFQNVAIGVNGLTCSQCSRTVEIGLRKLDFVADVEMNLEHTEGKIILKPGHKADMEKIAQAVIDAGFSLRYLRADLQLDNSVNASGSCFNYKGDEYVFTAAPKETLNGTVHLAFVGKKYQPKNEYKKMQPYMKNACGNVTTGKLYYVSL